MIVRARAPLRLGLAGGGTDVSPFCDLYGGYVMNAAIDKHAYAIVDASTSGRIEFSALDRKVAGSWSRQGFDCNERELQLIKGCYERISKDYGLDLPALRIRTYSDAPPGSGLGSSSTMVVAIIAALSEYFRLPLGEYEVAHLAYEVERNDLALSGGRQDQYAAAFGGFNFMEFGASDHVVVNPLRIKDWIANELEASIVLYFTGVSRESARIIDEQVKNARQGSRDPIEAMHELKHEAVQMKQDLLRGDVDGFARTLQRGWEAKKRMAANVSNPLIDRLEHIGASAGANAVKVSGAGGGGFMMFVCDPSDRISLCRALETEGGALLDFHFSPQGATAWTLGK